MNSSSSDILTGSHRGPYAVSSVQARSLCSMTIFKQRQRFLDEGKSREDVELYQASILIARCMAGGHLDAAGSH